VLYVKKQCSVLQDPARERMVDGDGLANPVLQAEVEASELPTEAPYSDLCASASLAVVGLTVLERRVLNALDLDADALQGLLGQRHQGPLLIGLDDQLDVTEPGDSVQDEADNELVLIWALAGHDMTKYILGLVAPHHDALHDGAVNPLLRDCSVAVRGLKRVELPAALQAVGRDMPVIKPNAGDLMVTTGVSASFLSEASPHDATFAP